MSSTPIATQSAIVTDRIRCSGMRSERRSLGLPPTPHLLGEQSQLERKLHVVGTVGNPELLLDALLVSVHGLRAYEQLLTDFRRGIALSDEPEHVLLALGEL